MGSITGIWDSLISLGCLASKSQGTSCLCLPSLRITSACHHAGISSWVLGRGAGPPVWQAQHWLSYLPSSRFPFIPNPWRPTLSPRKSLVIRACAQAQRSCSCVLSTQVHTSQHYGQAQGSPSSPLQGFLNVWGLFFNPVTRPSGLPHRQGEFKNLAQRESFHDKQDQACRPHNAGHCKSQTSPRGLTRYLGSCVTKEQSVLCRASSWMTSCFLFPPPSWG